MEDEEGDFYVKYSPEDADGDPANSPSTVKFFKRPQGNGDTERTNLLSRHRPPPLTVSYSEAHKLHGSAGRSIYISIGLADICQKIVYVCLLGNFVLFAASYLEMDATDAVLVVFGLYASMWLLCSLLALYTESFVVRSTAIIFGFFSYTFSSGILAVTSSYLEDGLSTLERIPVAIALICFVAGESLCRTQLTDFGKEQFADGGIPVELQNFTRGFYWCGHVIALLVIAVILAVQQFVSFKVGYFICTSISLMALIAFCWNWRHYTKLARKTENPLRRLISICREARIVSRTFGRKRVAFASGEDESKEPKQWLDYAMIRHGGTYEEADVLDARAAADGFLIFATFIPCWAVFAQVHSTFFFQALHMNLQLGSVTVPVSWLSLSNILTTLILVPTLDQIVYPKLDQGGRSFKTTWKVITGMVAGILAMVLAACIQASVASSSDTFQQVVGESVFDAARNVSVLWQIPQNVLLAASEVLMGLTALDLAYKLCAGSLQRLVTSSYYLMMALGSVMSLSLVSIGCSASLNHCSRVAMEIYFFVMAGALLLGSLAFMFVLHRRLDTSSQVSGVQSSLPLDNRDA